MSTATPVASSGMDYHPLANGYPLLEGAEYEAFKDDIKANGLTYDIWTFEGKILDGRNRYRACRELGIEPNSRPFEGDEDAARAFAASLNLHRRHLTAEFRRQRVAALRVQGMSTREIAEKVGCDPKTVRNDLKSGGDTSPPATALTPSTQRHDPDDAPDPPPKVKGKDGKKYDAKKATGKKRQDVPKPAAPSPPRAPVGDLPGVPTGQPSVALSPGALCDLILSRVAKRPDGEVVELTADELALVRLTQKVARDHLGWGVVPVVPPDHRTDTCYEAISLTDGSEYDHYYGPLTVRLTPSGNDLASKGFYVSVRTVLGVRHDKLPTGPSGLTRNLGSYMHDRQMSEWYAVPYDGKSKPWKTPGWE